MVSGKDFSETIRADVAGQPYSSPPVPLDQVVSNNLLEIGVEKTRESSNVLTADRLYYVTVSLRNLQPDARITVSGSDFVLVDGEGTTYYAYGIGDQVAQELAPLESRSFEMGFGIPREARELTLHFTFPGSGNAAVTHPVVFALP
jgi:hypothetical protein